MNPYARLMRLLPGRPLLIGEVTDFTDGVATLLMVGGGIAQARGAGLTVGNNYFFRDGAVEGPAPDLPEDIIEV